jgi:hypothetical protein
MRFSNLTFLLVAASATFGLAAPAEASSNTEASTSSEQWTCKNGWELCGVCVICCLELLLLLLC